MQQQSCRFGCPQLIDVGCNSLEWNSVATGLYIFIRERQLAQWPTGGYGTGPTVVLPLGFCYPPHVRRSIKCQARTENALTFPGAPTYNYVHSGASIAPLSDDYIKSSPASSRRLVKE
jgi:hypothetical protein